MRHVASSIEDVGGCMLIAIATFILLSAWKSDVVELKEWFYGHIHH
jgi:hypothetical protein